MITACALLLLAGTPLRTAASPRADGRARVTRYLVPIADLDAAELGPAEEDRDGIPGVWVPGPLWDRMESAYRKEPHYKAELEAKDREIAAKQREIESWARSAASADRRAAGWEAAAEKAYEALEPPSRLADPVVWVLGAGVVVLGVALAVVATRGAPDTVVVTP